MRTLFFPTTTLAFAAFCYASACAFSGKIAGPAPLIAGALMGSVMCVAAAAAEYVATRNRR